MSREPWSTERQVIAQLVRAIRKESGLSQAELAARTTFSQSDISRIETGERSLELAEISAISESCGTSLKQFVEHYLDQL